jgi:hypothetical protein
MSGNDEPTPVIDPALTVQIILAAVNATEPTSGRIDQGKVRENATDIALMVRPGSPLASHVQNLMGATPIRGILLGVKREEKTKRAMLHFYTQPGRYAHNKLGVETARTDFIEPEGGPGHALATRARDLIGKRVTVFKYMETPKGGGDPVRMAAEIRYAGVPTDEQLAEARAAYDQWLAEQARS